MAFYCPDRRSFPAGELFHLHGRAGQFPIGPTSALDDFFKRWQPGQIWHIIEPIGGKQFVLLQKVSGGKGTGHEITHRGWWKGFTGSPAVESGQKNEVTFRVRRIRVSVEGGKYIVQIGNPIEKLDKEIYDITKIIAFGLLTAMLLLVILYLIKLKHMFRRT